MTGSVEARRRAAAGPNPVPRLLASLAAGRRGSIAAVGVLVVAAAMVELAPALVVRDMVDGHFTAGRVEGVAGLAFLYLVAIAGMQMMMFLYGYIAAAAAQGMLSDLRTRLFSHLVRVPTGHFDRASIGDIVSRCTADVDALDTVFSSGVAVVLANLVRLTTIAVAMIVLSFALSVIAALVAAPLVLLTRVLQVRIRQAERQTRLAIGAVNTRLQEDLQGVEVIRAFGREPEFVAGFRRVLEQGLAASNRSTFYSALYPPTTAIVTAVALAALLVAGTHPALGAITTLGTLTAFLLLLQRFFQPITALGEEWQTVQGAMAGAERILETLALPQDEAFGAGRERPRDGCAAEAIVLQDVEFGYETGQPVVRGLTLRVGEGEHVAFVGRTGAGKTSALHLIAGLYRPWSGRVVVAGCDPARLAEDDRKRVLGVVPQAVHLFSGTVLDNLTLGDPSVTEDAVYEAAAIAGADEFLRALPRGYHTRLSGTGRGAGTHLSAGQRQLLSLARALVHRPVVLLLDEATAALDNASDAAFRAALRDRILPRGTAVVTIAHRLTTALDADRVIVLDRGLVAEEGSPATLAARPGCFAALLELEAAGWDWRSGG